jgi:hypothetical protein
LNVNSFATPKPKKSQKPQKPNKPFNQEIKESANQRNEAKRSDHEIAVL